MAISFPKTKPSILPKDCCFYITATACILIFCALWKFNPPLSRFSITSPQPNPTDCRRSARAHLIRNQDPENKTFYDDPETYYTIDKPIFNWDEKRKEWLKHHPGFASGIENRVLVVTGSQPSPCENPAGDHLLLRFLKNKVDYCRIHGYEIFYNTAFLDPKMKFFWAKIPLVRAAMVAHPDKEWIFWVDSDAMFTDMEFKLPLEKYKDFNFVVHGWPDLIYEKQSWVAVNAGVFLIRNCQWSMDFLDVWANMGPIGPDYRKWSEIQRSTFKDKMFPDSDDQSALIYLLLKENKKWGNKIYVQNEYEMNGYWLEIIGKFGNISKKYELIEKGVRRRRRRHAEAVSESYAADGEELRRLERWRRPFITHFTGCEPCSGDHNPTYGEDSCWKGIERALNFADNQVLRNYGFIHPDIGNGSSGLVTPLPFDYPVDGEIKN